MTAITNHYPEIKGTPIGAMAKKDKGKKKPPTQAKQLIDLAQARYDVIEDQHGKVYAIPKKAPRFAIPLKGRGSALTGRLKLDYFELAGTAPNATAITGAIDILEALAVGGDRVPIHLRTARTSSGLVIDLGDQKGRAVVIEGGKWRVAATPPDGIVFRRSKMTAEMPEPVRGGSLDALRPLLNTTDEGWGLLRSWLVMALLPNIPVPILCITGQQGSGKSVLGRALVSLVDPASAPLRAMPRDLGEWLTTAAASRVVGIDNISRIKEEMSDAFCRATTGEGSAKRELYTDEDLVIQTYRRALLLTSIDPGALRGDLGERLMLVELKRPSRRRGEEELDAKLDRLRPAIVGGLFDLLAEVLANPVKLTKAPRMADAANVMAAVDRVTGGDSLGAYLRGQENVAELVLESDPLATALVAVLTNRDQDEWSGTPTELFEAVLFQWDQDTKNRPATPKTMTERLNRIAPQLLEVRGLRVETTRGDERRVTLSWEKPRPVVRRRSGRKVKR